MWCGVLISALGIANMFDIANPPEVVILVAPYRGQFLVLGIVISAINVVGLYIVRKFYG